PPPPPPPPPPLFFIETAPPLYNPQRFVSAGYFFFNTRGYGMRFFPHTVGERPGGGPPDRPQS
ncbi:hypothetical protein ACVGWC_14415, partial [Enterobacter hormaechei]